MKGELVRYLVAGVAAFATDILVLFVCTDLLGWHYLYSNIASYSAGLLVSYWLNVSWVFSERRFRDKTTLEFVLFNAIVLFGFVLSESLMALLVEVVGLHYLHAKVASAVVVTVYNYLAKKLVLFSTISLVGRSTSD